MSQELVYEITGQSDRGMVARYHRKPDALFLNKTKSKTDMSGLKPRQQAVAIEFDGSEYTSKFTIGFEIEKNQMHRNVIREYPLFCGFEHDGSCGINGTDGYEAVTHILPLLPAGKWRNKVYNMFHEAERIIDDAHSPSDASCGGHITIAVDGMDGYKLRSDIRKNCGILLAMFRHRLNNKYCGSNRRMQDNHESGINSYGGAGYTYHSRECHHKYQTALVKGNCLEFRLPSRVQSVKQMMRRYELMHELVNFTVTKPNGSHDALIKTIKPILLSMYNGDVTKTDEVIRLSGLFRTFILKGTIHADIKKFLQ